MEHFTTREKVKDIHYDGTINIHIEDLQQAIRNVPTPALKHMIVKNSTLKGLMIDELKNRVEKEERCPKSSFRTSWRA